MTDKPCYGDWVKCGPLGCGTFGVVNLWENKVTLHKIAVKTCRKDRDLSAKNKKRWKQEVTILNKIKHRNVIKAEKLPDALHGVVDGGELPALCMEYCEGGDLRKTLSTVENSCGIKQSMIINITYDIAQAIQCLHGYDIAHRDLKPENIVIARYQNKITFKVIDLGYAKQLDQSYSQHSYVGTANYLAPEILLKVSRPYTKTVDYWSFGCLIYECCTGIRPFETCQSKDALEQIISKDLKFLSASLCNESGDSQLKFCDSFPETNQLDRTSQTLFEKLLCLLLDGCPERRGHGNSWMNCVQEIVEHKVLRVFCIDSCQPFVYQLLPDLSVPDVQYLIYEDTGIAQDQQELFLVDGSTFNSMTSLQDGTMLKDFIFVLSKFFKYENTVHCEDQMQSLLKELLLLPYKFCEKSMEHCKLVHQQSVFFVQKQQTYKSDLTRGLKALVISILKLRLQFNEFEKFQENITALKTLKDFFNMSLENDLRKYEDCAERNGFGKIPEAEWKVVLEKWQEMQRVVNNDDILIDQCYKVVEERHILQNKIIEMKNKDQINKAPKIVNEWLSKSVTQIRDMYNQVKTRGSWKENVDELNFFLQTFLQQMKSIEDEFYHFFIEVSNLRRQIKDYFVTLRSIDDKVTRSRLKIEQAQLARQNRLWQLILSDCNGVGKFQRNNIKQRNMNESVANVSRIKKMVETAKEQQKIMEMEIKNLDWSFASD